MAATLALGGEPCLGPLELVDGIVRAATHPVAAGQIFQVGGESPVITRVEREARRVLGWSPKVDLAEGMRRVEAWPREEGQLEQG